MSEVRKTIEASSIKRKGTAATVDRVEMRCARTKQGALCIKLVSYTGRTMADLVVPSEGVSDLAKLIALAAESARDAALRERDDLMERAKADLRFERARNEDIRARLTQAEKDRDAALAQVGELEKERGDFADVLCRDRLATYSHIMEAAHRAMERPTNPEVQAVVEQHREFLYGKLAAAEKAHADLLRNHRAAMEGALAEIGRLRGALLLAWDNGEFEHVSNCVHWRMSGVRCDCYVVKIETALSSTATVSVEPGDKVDARERVVVARCKAHRMTGCAACDGIAGAHDYVPAYGTQPTDKTDAAGLHHDRIHTDVGNARAAKVARNVKPDASAEGEG